jgi:hypothetical protein
MTEGYFINIAADPIREWTDESGEERLALSPLLLAIHQELKAEGAEPTFEMTLARRDDYAAHAREVTGELVQTVLDMDALQRENGYSGPADIIPDSSTSEGSEN